MENYLNSFSCELAFDLGQPSDQMSVTTPASKDGGFRVRIESELLLVTSGGLTTTWNITRGIEGTSAAYHGTGQAVRIVLTEGSLNQIRQDWIPIFSDAKPAGTVKSAKVEYQNVAAGATVDLINYIGDQPGYVSQIWWGITSTDAVARNDSVIKVYIDDEVVPSIDIPLKMLCGAEYGNTTSNGFWQSRFLGLSRHDSNQNCGYLFRIPIPFGARIRITLTNSSGSASLNLWCHIMYHLGVPNIWNRTRKLHAITGLGTYSVDQVATLLDVSEVGPGRLMGVYMNMDAFPGTANPKLAHLEGNVKITIDGTLAVESPGTEDYFLWTNYFQNLVAGTSYVNDFVGVTYIAGSSNGYSCHRFHIPDPIEFNDDLKITWNCGDSTQVNFTGTVRFSWTVWYYTEG